MGSKKVKRRLMLAARPSLRNHPKPPKARTLMGESFSMANFAGALMMQHCQECGLINYPPRERCYSCLSDDFRWRQTDTSGEIVSCSQIHISQWEFFKRKVKDAPWPIALVKLGGQILFVHLAVETLATPFLKPGTKVKVFSQSDMAQKSILIAVSEYTDIATASQRKAIAVAMGISE